MHGAFQNSLQSLRQLQRTRWQHQPAIDMRSLPIAPAIPFCSCANWTCFRHRRLAACCCGSEEAGLRFSLWRPSTGLRVLAVVLPRLCLLHFGQGMGKLQGQSMLREALPDCLRNFTAACDILDWPFLLCERFSSPLAAILLPAATIAFMNSQSH